MERRARALTLAFILLTLGLAMHGSRSADAGNRDRATIGQEAMSLTPAR